jgi:protein-L-isoaspartate(D-aspartate) O-methyltransferase
MLDKLLGPRYDAYLGFIRRQMIKDQIEARGVKDPRVLAAMDKVCRHCFVPEDLVTRAYEDYPLPISRGQTVSQPYIVALMSELAGLKGGGRVLEIGTGSGYQAAVLAELAAEVDTVELYPDLAEQARARLAKLGYKNINFRTGDGAAGWPERAPYDAILVTCAAPEVPPALPAQLKEGGRLVIPVGAEPQDLKLITRTPGGLKEETACSVRFVPMLKEAL